MRPAHFLKSGLFFLVFLGGSLMVHFGASVAQPPQTLQPPPAPPEVSLTIYIVPELSACPPNGYTDYDSGKSNCTKLTMQDIPKFEKALQTESVPPSAIKLNKDLSDILDAYRTAGRSNPKKRLSIVLVFNWNRPIGAHVSLQRIIKSGCEEVFPAMSWPGDLKSEQHWIHHERADAFLPGYQVEWILKVGEYPPWDFHTE